MEISVKWLYLFTLSLFVPDTASLQGQALPQAKLIVDDGRYQQSGFVRQIAVTTDDRYVLVSDSKSGVRTYDMANGALINSLEGHALEGDSYYDPQHELLVTSGDLKLKIWDIRQQKLLKTIRQPFIPSL
jgi:WD40 repeat protein